ncbi:MAG TPA: class I SAM-dependent methyltransferase [Gammaproteobacteria bacterium]|nr:class I SAM-dependent methyltransferase [Gammaproteobacteria bacterium]
MNEDAVTRLNVERFNAVAGSWDENPVRVELAQAVARAIGEAVPPTAQTRAMEFGCGTGLVTALLAPGLGHVVAVDSAAGMLDVLRTKVRELGLDNVEPLEMDLAQSLPEGPFDLIFSGMTLHHIEDVPALLARLRGLLAPGGHVALADLEREDGTFHGDAPGIMHHGFDPSSVAGWLAEAGFDEVHTRRVHVVRKTGSDDRPREYPVFLADARRAAGR